MRKAQMNSEILKWILMIVIFAVVVVLIIVMQKDLPAIVSDIIKKIGIVV